MDDKLARELVKAISDLVDEARKTNVNLNQIENKLLFLNHLSKLSELGGLSNLNNLSDITNRIHRVGEELALVQRRIAELSRD